MDFAQRQLHGLATWPELVAIEPELLDVEKFVRGLPEDRTYNDWERVKNRFKSLVGWNSRRPALQNYRAHDACYRYLLDIFEENQG